MKTPCVLEITRKDVLVAISIFWGVMAGGAALLCAAIKLAGAL